MESITVTICDWAKFNPRVDSKSHSWFRLQNNFFTKTFSWTSNEREVFLYISCLCSEEKKETITPDISLMSATLKRKPMQIFADLKHLEARGKVTLSNSKLLEVTESKSLPTNVRTYVTNERIYSPEFLKFWESYPKHVAKAKASQAFENNVRNILEFEQLDYALKNYLQYCKINDRFHKDPTTFLNQWHDWLEPEVPLDMSEDDANRFSFLKDKKLRDVNDTP